MSLSIYFEWLATKWIGEEVPYYILHPFRGA
jgi:hypothetical protein